MFNAKAIKKLSDRELLEEHSSVVKWWHYDPMGTERPSKFDLDELEREILRRMGEEQDSQEED